MVDLGGRPFIDDRLAGEVAHGDADVLVAEIQADRERGARNEREQHRWAPGSGDHAAFAALLARCGDSPSARLHDELLGQRRDRRPGEPGVARQITAARGRIAIQRLQDPQPVHRPQAKSGVCAHSDFTRRNLPGAPDYCKAFCLALDARPVANAIKELDFCQNPT